MVLLPPRGLLTPHHIATEKTDQKNHNPANDHCLSAFCTLRGIIVMALLAQELGGALLHPLNELGHLGMAA